MSADLADCCHAAELCSRDLTRGLFDMCARGWTDLHVTVVWQSWHWNEKRKVSEYYDALQAINAQKGAFDACNGNLLVWFVLAAGCCMCFTPASRPS